MRGTKRKPKIQRVAGAIEVHDDVITNHRQVLDEIKAQNNWQDAFIGIDSDAKRDLSIRDNDVHWVDPFDFRTPPLLFEFVRNVWFKLDDYGLRYERPFSSLESVNINRYLPGQQYHAHVDAGGQSRRVISAVLYLNDDFTGGETEFPLFGETITPKAGRLVIFPSNYAYVHAALPPTKGTKYSAAFWVSM